VLRRYAGSLSWLLGVQASLMVALRRPGRQRQSCRQRSDGTTFYIKAESGPVKVGAVLSSMLIVWLRLALTFPQRSVTVYVRTTNYRTSSTWGSVGMLDAELGCWGCKASLMVAPAATRPATSELQAKPRWHNLLY